MSRIAGPYGNSKFWEAARLFSKVAIFPPAVLVSPTLFIVFLSDYSHPGQSEVIFHCSCLHFDLHFPSD